MRISKGYLLGSWCVSSSYPLQEQCRGTGTGKMKKLFTGKHLHLKKHILVHNLPNVCNVAREQFVFLCGKFLFNNNIRLLWVQDFYHMIVDKGADQVNYQAHKSRVHNNLIVLSIRTKILRVIITNYCFSINQIIYYSIKTLSSSSLQTSRKCIEAAPILLRHC